MNTKRIVLLTVFAAVAASGSMQAELLSVPRRAAGPSGRRLPSRSPESRKDEAKRGKKLYETLKDDWKCLLDRKRKCNWKQKARIIVELQALLSFIVMVGGGAAYGGAALQEYRKKRGYRELDLD